MTQSLWPSFEDTVKQASSNIQTKANDNIWPAFEHVVKPPAPVLNQAGKDVSQHPFNPLAPNNQVGKDLPKSNIVLDTIKDIPKAAVTTIADFAKGLVNKFVEGGTSLVNAGRNVESIVKGDIEQIKTRKPAQFQDYSNETYNIPGYGEAKPLITGHESPVDMLRKTTGAALEIAPLFLAIPEGKILVDTLKTIGQKSLSEITQKEAIDYTKAYAKKILASSLTLGPMFGEGQNLSQNADLKTSIKNIWNSTKTVAAMEALLSPILGKVFKGKEDITVDEAVKPVESQLHEITPEVTQAIPTSHDLNVPKSTRLVSEPTIFGTDASKEKTNLVEPDQNLSTKKELPLKNEFDQLKEYVKSQVENQSDTKQKEIVKEFTSLKRQLEGNPTKLEFKKAEADLTKNYEGKNVKVNGKDGVIVKSNSRTADVKLSNGRIVTFKASEITSRKVSERSVLKSIRENAKAAIEQKKSEYKDFKPVQDLLKKGVNEIKVPESQLPVGEGELKASRLEQRVTETLKKTPQEVKDALGSSYLTMNKKEQIAAATDYVTKNSEEAMSVLRGETPAPHGLLTNSIYVAMENLAKDDAALARKLASLRSTRLGQELSILTEVDPSSPVKLLREITDVREASYTKKTGETIEKAKAREVQKIKSEVAKRQSTKQTWESFIETIKCK